LTGPVTRWAADGAPGAGRRANECPFWYYGALVVTGVGLGQETWFRHIFASNMVGIGMWTGDGSIAEANDALLDLLGYTRAELEAGELRWSRINAPEFRALDERAMRESRARGHSTPYEKEYVRRDGSRVAVLVGGAYFDPESDKAGILFALDMSAQTRAEARLRLLVDAGATLASSLDFATTIANVARLAVPEFADWCTVRVVGDDRSVQQFAVAHRDPAKEELARELARLYPVDPDAEHGIAPVIRLGETQLDPLVTDEMLVAGTRDEEHRRRMRELAPRSRLSVPLAARERILGAISFVVVEPGRAYGPEDVPFAQELARRCALAIDNARLHLEAQLAVRSRDEFLSIASHELRTPVTTVRGYAQLLQRDLARGGLVRERVERAIEAIAESTDRLAHLTRDLLDLVGLIETVAAPYRASLGERHRLRLELPEAPVRVTADGERLTQVLTNLLDNALKYSPEGGEIAVSLLRCGEEVTLRVRDGGIGVPAEALETIFQPFSRAPNAEESPMPGMGLGLFVCRSIVERHGGRLWAESEGEGRGTTVVAVLPTGAEVSSG
jgi:PAS domain S-box-containing protein